MIQGLKYCIKCVMPETVEGQSFDGEGLCRTCVSQGQKDNIDWFARQEALSKILQDAKDKAGNNYDCIVPISGGKDSLWQLHVIVKEYGMKPLAVTFNHNWFSKTGWYNLQNGLEKMDIDHVMFTPSRSLVNRTARRSVETIGDACWHCHAGVAAFTIKMAVAYKIPLLICGESTAEHGRATYEQPDKFDRDYFLRVSSKLTPVQFSCEYLTLRDLYPFEVPTAEECEAIGLNGIHLGDYVKWNTEKQVKYVKDKYGWKGREVSGAYKDYKSVECSMAGIHDFLCYLKRGYGRASIQASDDLRAGLINREEAEIIIKATEQQEPKAMDYFLKNAGLDLAKLIEKIIPLRHEKLNGTELQIYREWRECEEDGKPYMQRLIDGEV